MQNSEIEKEELLKRTIEASNHFIEDFLDPTKEFVKNIKNKYYLLRYHDLHNMIDKDEIANYIKEMDYQDFLHTPYWDAVRSKKLYEAHFKCQLCGETGIKLNVHHNSYERHGYEAEYYKEDLIVLCDECHEKFHNKKE